MKRYLSLLMGILGFVPILAQQSEYYYYYKGERIALTVDSTRLYVVSDGKLQAQSTARSAEPQVAMSVKSDIRSQVVPLQKQRTAISDVYFSALDVPQGTTASQYEALVGKMKAEEEVFQVLPSFTVGGNRVDVTNNFYVRLKSADDLPKLQQLAAQHGIEVVGNNEFLPLWYVLSCTSTSSMNAIEAANHFHTSGMFESSSPEILSYSTQSVGTHVDANEDANVHARSNDVYLGRQWALYNDEYPGRDINIEGAWEITRGAGTVVAVISDGVYFHHPDLYDNKYSLNYEDNAASSSSSYMQDGTRCAGVIGATQSEDNGMIGVAPECKIMSVAFDFQHGVSAYKIATGMLWAMNNGAHVICFPKNRLPDDALDDAILTVLDEGRDGKGCVLVAGAGGSHDDALNCRYPISIDPRIIAVGFAMKCGARAQTGVCEHSPILWNSCYGDSLDVIAPGASIFTTVENQSYPQYANDFEGTDAACAHVAGIAALMLSANPELPVEAVDFIIGNSARKERTDLYSYAKDNTHLNGTWNNEVGYGFVDATAAVAKAFATSYVWRQDYYEANDRYFENTNIDVRNITVEDGDHFHIIKEKTAILRSSVRIKEGGELLILPPL